MSEDAALAPRAGQYPIADERVSLVDLLDRVLATGVVITGDVRLSIADVDLVTISLRALVSSMSTAFPASTGSPGSTGSPASAAFPGDGGSPP